VSANAKLMFPGPTRVTPISDIDRLNAARAVFEYLSKQDALPSVVTDAVIGFGTFDITLASFCGDLYANQHARRIIFTGGFGAGTADLGMPEADAWRLQLGRTHPTIPAKDLIIENRSTNTAENILFTAALLSASQPRLKFGEGLAQVLIVAAPSRLRRVKLTLKQLFPSVRTTLCRPETTFEHERALFTAKGLNFVSHLQGEIERLMTYPARGWIAPEPLPPEIAQAHAILKSS